MPGPFHEFTVSKSGRDSLRGDDATAAWVCRAQEQAQLFTSGEACVVVWHLAADHQTGREVEVRHSEN